MALEQVTQCPICSSNSFNKFIVCEDYTASKEKFNLSSCSTCNFLITTPRPDAKNIGTYYKSQSYISHTGSGKGLINSIYLLVRRYTLNWKVNKIKEYQSTGKLLDYGCGTGEFLHKAHEHEFDITGVEPSDDARKKAESIIGKKIENHLDNLKGEKFNVITLWHVLEHVPDLKEKLSQLKELLEVNGTIFIAVPNHNSYDALHYKEYWAGYDVPRHLWHFSKENMKALLEEINLKVIEIKPMKLDSYYVSLLSEGYKYKAKNPLLKLMSGILNGMKSNIVAKKSMNYSSLIYIAKS